MNEKPPGSVGIIAGILLAGSFMVRRIAVAWSVQRGDDSLCLVRDFIHGRCYAVLNSIQKEDRCLGIQETTR